MFSRSVTAAAGTIFRGTKKLLPAKGPNSKKYKKVVYEEESESEPELEQEEDEEFKNELEKEHETKKQR